MCFESVFEDSSFFSLNEVLFLSLVNRGIGRRVSRLADFFDFLDALLAGFAPHEFHDDGEEEGPDDAGDHNGEAARTHGVLALFRGAAPLKAVVAFHRAVLDRAQVARGLIAHAVCASRPDKDGSAGIVAHGGRAAAGFRALVLRALAAFAALTLALAAAATGLLFGRLRRLCHDGLIEHHNAHQEANKYDELPCAHLFTFYLI